VNEVPGLSRLQPVHVCWHGRPIQPSHENAVEISVGLSALEACSRAEIVWDNRIVFAVKQCRGRRPVPVPLFTMTLEAFQRLVHLLAALDAIGCDRRLGGDLDRRIRLFFLEALRERLDVCDKIGALLAREGIPSGHCGRVDTPADGVEQIAVEWNAARGRRAALEEAHREIARLGMNVGSVLTLSVSAWAVTADAVAPVQLLPALRTACQVSDLAFLGNGAAAATEESQLKDD